MEYRKGIEEYKGYWWLPDKPGDQLAGVLRVEPEGKLLLEIFGAFGFEGDGVDLEKMLDNVIYGRCYAPNGHMKDVSLYHCHPAVSLNFSSSFPITRYTCRYSFIGIHVESMETASFFRAYVDYDELTSFLPPRNVQTVYGDSSISINIDTSRDKDAMATIHLDDGVTLKLNQGVSYQPNYPKVIIDQSTYLEVQKEGLSGNMVLSSARKFERFLTLAMLAPVEHGKIVVYSKEYCQTLNNGETYYHPIEFISYLYQYKEKRVEEISRHEMLFDFTDVQQKFEEMYRLYYSDRNIAQIWTNLIDSLEKKRVYSSNDFLVVAQAVDGFSICFRKEMGFLDQCKALRDEFHDVEKVSISDSELESIKSSRHYYSHILSIDKKAKTHVLEGIDLYKLTRKLRVLLICCILNFLGFDNGLINKLLNQCYNPLLKIRGNRQFKG